MAFGFGAKAAPAEAPTFEVTRSDGEWRRLLTPEQYADAVTAGLADPIRACGRRDCASFAGLAGLILIWIAAALTPIRAAYIPVVTWLPAWVAKEKGMFAALHPLRLARR